MSGLRAVLAVIFVVVVGYTAVVIAREGMGFLPIFFGDIADATWRGQFNMDFLGFLTLSALWVAWRHQFAALGFAFALLAFLGGIVFLSVYLTVVSFQSRNMAELMLGPARAGG